MSSLRTAVGASVISLLVACVTAQVKITSENETDARERRIDEISSVLTAELPAILELLDRRVGRLRPSDDGLSFPAADVEALLSDVERALLEALEDDDVAALRNLIAHEFARTRKELRLARAEVGRNQVVQAPVRLAAIRLASEPPGARWVDRLSTEAALAAIRELIELLAKRAAERDLVVDLCVVSRPAGAEFSMSAPSLPGVPYGTHTTGNVVNVSRGRYGYSVIEGSPAGLSWKGTRGTSPGGGRGIRCPAPRPGDDWTCVPIDLWKDPRPVLECDFSAGNCWRREPEARECAEAGS